MQIVIITALAVGLSTVIGSLLSFWIREVPKEIENMLMSFAAGIMLAATFVSLIMPALGETPLLKNNILVAAGLITGGFIIALTEKFVPHLHLHMDMPKNDIAQGQALDKVMLFVIAIAIHNFPEGMAVGVSLGEDVRNAFGLAIGISVQNIPEGLVTILPLLLAGVPMKKAFVIGLITGLIEVVGIFVGYMAVNISTSILPFILAFAAGTMIFVISHDMIPSTHAGIHDDKRPTYALIAGVAAMIMLEYVGELL